MRSSASGSKQIGQLYGISGRLHRMRPLITYKGVLFRLVFAVLLVLGHADVPIL